VPCLRYLGVRTGLIRGDPYADLEEEIRAEEEQDERQVQEEERLDPYRPE